MNENAFIGFEEAPTDEQLSAALGAKRALWDEVTGVLGGEFGLETSDWHSYSKKYGWALRVRRKERKIVYLSACAGGKIIASFVLGQKAIEAAKASKLPKSALDLIANARRYAEGTAVYLDLKKSTDLAVLRKLVAAKLAN